MDSSDRLGVIVIGFATGAILALFALVYTSDTAQRACSKEIAALGSYNPDEIRRICK